MKVYISGPMSGFPEHNYPAFRAMHEKLERCNDFARGNGLSERSIIEILDPSENFDGKTGLPREDYFRLDVEKVLDANAVVVLKGWQASAGARLEVALAKELGLPVFREVDKSNYNGSYPDSFGDEFEPEELGIFNTGGKGDPRFHALLQQIADLHDKKQADYGKTTDPFANVRASGNWGVKPWVGALVRLNDKVSRLQSFAQKGSLANESAEDSMMDIAVYALIALILYREESVGDKFDSAVRAAVRG